jgi:hypothetical protein
MEAYIAQAHERDSETISTLRAERDALKADAEEANSDALRLALELECLLNDKDVPMPAVSRWWNSAHDALELHRQRIDAARRS